MIQNAKGLLFFVLVERYATAAEQQKTKGANAAHVQKKAHGLWIFRGRCGKSLELV
jgi:hypothetical protein